MAMNLLNISKEIKKINEALDYLKTQNNGLVNHLNNAYEVSNISDEIKNDINEINDKLTRIYNFNINCRFNYENKNYNEINDFLTHINIDTITINKIIFLECGSLNDILLLDDEVLEKLDIPIEIIEFIKEKIEDKLYVSSVDI
jgi:hypothetical protein